MGKKEIIRNTLIGALAILAFSSNYIVNKIKESRGKEIFNNYSVYKQERDSLEKVHQKQLDSLDIGYYIQLQSLESKFRKFGK